MVFKQKQRVFVFHPKLMACLSARRYKDSAAIMQLLRDNLALWQNDLPGVELAQASNSLRNDLKSNTISPELALIVLSMRHRVLNSGFLQSSFGNHWLLGPDNYAPK